MTVRHLTEDELAERLGVAAITLRKWRGQGKGPAFLKAGSVGLIRYREKDVEAWEESRLVKPATA